MGPLSILLSTVSTQEVLCLFDSILTRPCSGDDLVKDELTLVGDRADISHEYSLALAHGRGHSSLRRNRNFAKFDKFAGGEYPHVGCAFTSSQPHWKV